MAYKLLPSLFAVSVQPAMAGTLQWWRRRWNKRHRFWFYKDPYSQKWRMLQDEEEDTLQSFLATEPAMAIYLHNTVADQDDVLEAPVWAEPEAGWVYDPHSTQVTMGQAGNGTAPIVEAASKGQGRMLAALASNGNSIARDGKTTTQAFMEG